jgi:hypothetical protein
MRPVKIEIKAGGLDLDWNHADAIMGQKKSHEVRKNAFFMRLPKIVHNPGLFSATPFKGQVWQQRNLYYSSA